MRWPEGYPLLRRDMTPEQREHVRRLHPDYRPDRWWHHALWWGAGLALWGLYLAGIWQLVGRLWPA